MRSLPALLLVAFACGVCLLQASPALPPYPALVAAMSLCALIASARAPQGRLRVVAVACAVALGSGYAALRAEWRLSDALAHEWEGEDLRIVGVVDELPTLSDRGVRFAFAVERVATPRARVPSRISLVWYVHGSEAGQVDIPSVRAGERWSLKVRLKRPHGNVNPGGFDLEAWLLQQGLRATGYVVKDDGNVLESAFAGRVRRLRAAGPRARARTHRAHAGRRPVCAA